MKHSSPQGKIALDQKDVLAEVVARAEQKGDLPIFNASLAKVRRISSDPESHAMELAQTVMNDANLSTKLLRIANSPYYSRGLGRISSVSRAVVILGFETIRNLCLTLKLIESFESEHPAIGMQQMLTRAYLAAGFVRELAMECGLKDAEEAYLCGLLHSLGEIAVAYFAPMRFNELVELQRSTGMGWEQAQMRVLGVSLDEVGQQLAATWNFSTKISATMNRYRQSRPGVVRNRDELTHALASMGSEVVGKLYVEHNETGGSLRELMLTLSDVTGLRSDRLEQSLTRSFEASCALAKDYGLPQRVLQPVVRASEDDLRDRLSREFAFYAASKVDSGGRSELAAGGTATSRPAGPSPAPGSKAVVGAASGASQGAGPGGIIIVSGGSEPSAAPQGIAERGGAAAPAASVPSSRGDPLLQLSVIQEITAMVTEGATLNTVLVKVLEGLNRGVGFDRAMLVLLSPDRSAYQARIAMGKNTDVLRLAISGPFKEKSDLFCKTMCEGADLLVENIHDAAWSSLLPPARAAALGVTSFVIAGVRSGAKPIGLFYSDNGVNGPPVNAEQRRGFSQFIAQARLAIQVRG